MPFFILKQMYCNCNINIYTLSLKIARSMKHCVGDNMYVILKPINWLYMLIIDIIIPSLMKNLLSFIVYCFVEVNLNQPNGQIKLSSRPRLNR